MGRRGLLCGILPRPIPAPVTGDPARSAPLTASESAQRRGFAGLVDFNAVTTQAHADAGANGRRLTIVAEKRFVTDPPLVLVAHDDREHVRQRSQLTHRAELARLRFDRHGQKVRWREFQHSI